VRDRIKESRSRASQGGSPGPLHGDRRRRPMGPAPASAGFFIYVTRPAPRQGQPPTPAGAVTLRDLTARDRRRVEPADHDGPLCRRCHGQALTPTSILCPARQCQRRDGVGSISLSVRRPEPSPHRRSCILLAAAWLLSLRTHATAPCYTPLNDGFSDATEAMWQWRNHHDPGSPSVPTGGEFSIPGRNRRFAGLLS
jgi:hypothetical protein